MSATCCVERLDVQDPAFAASVIDNMPFDRAVAVLEQPGFDHPQARINTGWTRRAPEGGTGTIRSNLPREGFTNAATAQMLPRRIANPTKKARTETSRNSRTETQGLHEQEPGLAIWARKRSASAR